jgi:hypothetical protein
MGAVSKIDEIAAACERLRAVVGETTYRETQERVWSDILRPEMKTFGAISSHPELWPTFLRELKKLVQH